MKKYILILLFIILVFPTYLFALESKNNLSISTSRVGYFYKKDEQGNYIDNAEFILRDLNSTLKYEVYYLEDENVYAYFEEIPEEYDSLLNLIPSSVKDIINGFSNQDDFSQYIITYEHDSTIKEFKYIYADCIERKIYLEDSKVLDKYNVKKMGYVPNYESCVVNIPTIMFVEEVKTPKGLEKEISAVPSRVYLKYYFDEETGNIINRESYLYVNYNFRPSYFFDSYLDENNDIKSIYQMYKYDDTLDYNNIESVYNAFINYDGSMNYPYTPACVFTSPNISKQSSKYNTLNINNNIEFSEKCSTPIIVDKKGSSALSVNSYVNSKEEVNLTESSNVEIKVFLKNTGKAPSYENKVVSNVPEGVEYVVGSASDNGVYDEEKNTVTWDLDYLDASSGYIFSYEVAVTTGSKESIYITTSSVSSEDNTTPIVSNEAKVTTPGVGGDAPEEEEEITNPKTGDDLNFALILGLLIGSIALISIKNRKPLGL